MGPKVFARRFLVLCALSVFYSTTANAQYRISSLSYGGSGCPSGSASAVLTDDQLGFLVMFDQLISESGSNVLRKIDRQSCILRQTVDVLAGYQIRLTTLKVKGFVNVPIGGVVTIESTASFVGMSQSIRKIKVFRGPAQTHFKFESDTLSAEQSWTPCGRSVIVEHGLNIRSQTNFKSDPTLILADGFYFGSNDEFEPIRFEFRRCK